MAARSVKETPAQKKKREWREKMKSITFTRVPGGGRG